MTGLSPDRRAGPTRWSWLVLLLLAITVPMTARGQEPVVIPSDTVAADTVTVPVPPQATTSDSLPVDTAAVDSFRAIRPFPDFPRGGRRGWGGNVREFGPEELLGYHSLSLLQLLERVPGLGVLRVGNFGAPAGITTLGGGGSRVRVFLDGFEIDPLGFTTHDLQQIALGDLERVRVERRFDGIRIDLTPMKLPGPRPLSGIEAATGAYDSKMLRALLIRGVGGSTLLTAGYDQASSQGVGFEDPFSFSSGRARLSYDLGSGTVLQAEYRSENAKSRERGASLDANRTTTLLRARSEPLPGLMLDGMIGRTTRTPESVDSLDATLGTTQGALRAALDLGRIWAEGSVRARSRGDELGLPARELEGRGGVLLLPWVSVEGEARTGEVLGAAGTRGSATARLGPLFGLSGFTMIGFGDQPLVTVRDTTLYLPVADTVDAPIEAHVEPRFSARAASAGGTRIGAEWGLPRGVIGVAGVLLPDGYSAPFGFRRLDRGREPIEVGEARGVEVYASLPVPLTRDFLRLEGWYSRWQELGGRPYLPEDEGRVALQAHGIFFAGDLEPTLRVEVLRRGSMLIPGDAPEVPMTPTAAYSLANLQLEIRILDVRAFFVFDNVTNIRTAADFPDRYLPGALFYYGLRWTFRN